MKVFLILAAVTSAAIAGGIIDFQNIPEEQLMQMDYGANMSYFLVDDETAPGHYVVEDLVNAEVIQSTEENDLTYYFYSQKDVNKGTPIKMTNLDALTGTDFHPNQETLLIIHGWKNSYESDVNVLIKKAVLEKFAINIFVVDWSPIASRNYISARWAVPSVGIYVGNFIRALETKFSVQLSRVAIVGHSLGAHVSGNAGAQVNSEVSFIVGLDPALPLFSYDNTKERLDPTDAQFVQVIHTCGGMLGFAAPIGHVDHYPNGGSSQPGCGWDLTCSCAHGRAYHYYAESVVPLTVPFIGTQCSSYNDYKNGRCTNNPTSVLGGYLIDNISRGVYYLTTNDKSPFAKS